MQHRDFRRWIFAIGLVFVLAACASGIAQTPQAEGSLPPTEAGSMESVNTSPAATQEEVSAPTLVPVKSALEATDPATVELASGGPLLVEFFAFW